MRITKQVLARRWAVFSVLTALVFAVLAWSDLRLKSLSGFSTADLQGFSTAGQYRQAFMAWPAHDAVRAGFNWGLDYLLMPLYAATFFYSGILTREAFAPGPGRARRILTLLAAVPIAGAALDAVENALQLTLMLSGLSDQLARIALGVSMPNGWRSISGWRCGWGRCGAASWSASGDGLAGQSSPEKAVLDRKAPMRIFRRSPGDSLPWKNN
jgi:hypothetical protein